MAVIISLLRGINLGGHKLVRMEALRSLYQDLGLADPQTLLQSGNVVFRTRAQDLAGLARKIERGIETSFGFHSEVVLRTSSDLRKVLARNPFASRPQIEFSKLVVTFLTSQPSPETCDAIAKISCTPEEFCLHGREFYAYFPNGFGRSKLPALMEKALKKSGTSRNWNTVLKLLELAEKLETPD